MRSCFFNLMMLIIFPENLCTNRISSSTEVFSSLLHQLQFPQCQEIPKVSKNISKRDVQMQFTTTEGKYFLILFSVTNSNIFNLSRPLFLHLKNDRPELEDLELYEIQISEVHNIIPQQCCLCIRSHNCYEIHSNCSSSFVTGFTKSSFLFRIYK